MYRCIYIYTIVFNGVTTDLLLGAPLCTRVVMFFVFSEFVSRGESKYVATTGCPRLKHIHPKQSRISVNQVSRPERRERLRHDCNDYITPLCIHMAFFVGDIHARPFHVLRSTPGITCALTLVTPFVFLISSF